MISAMIHLLFLLQSATWANTSMVTATATFIDQCSNEPVSITTPNGLGLRININGLDPNSTLTLHVTLSLAGVHQDESKSKNIEYDYFYNAHRFTLPFSKTIYLPKNRRLNQLEQKNPGSRVWNAVVEWVQNKNAGNTVASIYRTDDTEKSFFHPISPVQCNWETTPALSSQFYYNADQPLLMINRETYEEDQTGVQSGVQHGPNPINPAGVGTDNGGVYPNQTGSIAPSYVYYFKSRNSVSAFHHILTIHREWELVRGQGAVFADRISFQRMLVERYEWLDANETDTNQCGRYKKTAVGLLDVGVRTTDLYSVPPSFSGSAEKMLDFINIYRPPLSSCEGIYQDLPQHAETILNSGEDPNQAVLFFNNKII